MVMARESKKAARAAFFVSSYTTFRFHRPNRNT